MNNSKQSGEKGQPFDKNQNGGGDFDDSLMDSWIDNTLGDVNVPFELKSRLIEISNQNPVEQQVDQEFREWQEKKVVSLSDDLLDDKGTSTFRSFGRRLVALTLGTSAVVLMIFVLSVSFQPVEQLKPSTFSKGPDSLPVREGVVGQGKNSVVKESYQKLKEKVTILERQIRMLSGGGTDQLAFKSKKLRRLRLENAVYQKVDANDEISATLVVTQQAALDLGADKKLVLSNLKEIASNYSTNYGGRIAEQMINKHNWSD